MVHIFHFSLQAAPNNFSDFNKLFNSGMDCGVTSLTINNKKYFVIRADKEDKTIEGKCGPGGFCAAKGDTCKWSAGKTHCTNNSTCLQTSYVHSFFFSSYIFPWTIYEEVNSHFVEWLNNLENVKSLSWKQQWNKPCIRFHLYKVSDNRREIIYMYSAYLGEINACTLKIGK